MRLKKLAIQGLLAAVLAIGFGLTAITNSYANYRNHDNNPPTTQQVAFATKTADLMQATLFAALLQEFKETREMPDTVEQGKDSISLIFNDANKDMRLIGTIGPLRESDRPSGSFEETANAQVLAGATAPLTKVEQVNGKWYYRRAIPLSNFDSSCAQCHINYKNFPKTQPVGALALRIPIKQSS